MTVAPPDLIVSVLGTAIGIQGPPSLLYDLRPLLSDLPRGREATRVLTLEPGASGGILIRENGVVLMSNVAPALVAATIVWHCNTIAAASTEHIVIHAAAVGADGAVILPGASGAGKSTLTEACVSAGMSYLSDEFAAIDPLRGWVTPYPKPLSLRRDALVAASQLRAGSVSGARFPSGIVFPHYEHGVEDVATRLTPQAALVLLATHTLGVATRDGQALAWLAGLAGSCPAWQVRYGRTQTALDLVRAAGEGRSIAVHAAETIGPVTANTVTVVLDDGLAVLQRDTGQIHVLNRSAAFVWASVPDASDQGHLEDLVLDRNLGGSLSRADVTAVIEHLVRCGLLHWIGNG